MEVIEIKINDYRCVQVCGTAQCKTEKSKAVK